MLNSPFEVTGHILKYAEVEKSALLYGVMGPLFYLKVVVVVVVYFILSRLLYLAFSANLGLLCMPHPGMGPLV